MDRPRTEAGRKLLSAHPEIPAESVIDVELQARGQGAIDDRDRQDRVMDRIRLLLTNEQAAAVQAVRILDPDAIAAIDDGTLRTVLSGLADPTLTPAADAETREAARRYLEEIM
jgi:hypothetical protein